MKHSPRHDNPVPQPERDQRRGSALVIAVFVLALLTGTGVALLFLSRTEMQMSRADNFSKKAFYMAEAGLEDGRASLFNVNGKDPFDDDLLAVAGADTVIDFDPAAVVSVYDVNGNFTGFTGYGDDLPLRPALPFSDGWYAAFLTNDFTDGRSTTVDNNNRVMLTGVGVLPNRSEEIVEAVILKRNLFPATPPATITMIGPSPKFYGATSATKEYLGDDCDGSGIPGLYVPVVGTMGSSAELSAEAGLTSNPDYESGGYQDHAVFADLTDPSEPTVTIPLDPAFSDCDSLADFLDDARELADNVCSGNLFCDTLTPCGACDPRNTVPGGVTFVDGNYRVQGNLRGKGLLIVTGYAEFGGTIDWDGLLFIVGSGGFRINGSGTGTISGGIFLADIAGPDGVYGYKCSVSGTRCWTASDCPLGQSCIRSDDTCTGGDNGFGDSVYDERGGGNSGTIYCSTALELSNPPRPYEIISFLQR